MTFQPEGILGSIRRIPGHNDMIRICKKIVIFKLSTDLKYLEVVQGGVSSLFFTCAPSHIGAVQRKHILKVKKILEDNDHQSDWYAGKLGKF